MTAEASGVRQTPVIDRRVLEQLACPVCFGTLQAADDAVVCEGCGRIYPVIDGIPVLIAERAAKTC
jgi:uncharacterized protein